MIPLYTKEEFDNARSEDLLPLKCEQCGETFFALKKTINYKLSHPSHKTYGNGCRFCSTRCTHESQKKLVYTFCAKCGKEIEITPAQAARSKSGNHFCSKSCAVAYNNTHKSFGTRRSKLEEYLEKNLSELYPNLEIKYNSKEEINSELDIFIPKYNLAFELNGIFHYEPIFGSQKLLSTQENDKNKFRLCQENNISLCVIDTSALKYFKEQNAEKYLKIVTNIINENINNVTD